MIDNQRIERDLKKEYKSMKVWFNHWFSSAYYYMKSLKELQTLDIDLLVSSNIENPVYKSLGNQFELEFKVDNNNYKERLEEIANKFKPDISFLHGNINNFDEIEKMTKVVTTTKSDSLYEIMNNKVLFLDKVKRERLFTSVITAPKYFKVRNLEEYMEAVNEIGLDRVCVKPIKGIGGVGFHKITNKETTIKDFLESYSIYNHSDIVNFLQRNDAEFLVMRYYKGYEYSLDCFAQNGELKVCIPRKKISKRSTLLEYNEELIKFARNIAEKFRLNNCFNIQLFETGNEYVLNEINTRISGGAWMSEKIGLNFSLMCIANTLLENYKIDDMTNEKFQKKEFLKLEYCIEA